MFVLVVRFLGFGLLCTPCLSVHTGIQLAVCYPAQLCCFVYVLRLLALHYPLVMHGVERGSHPAGGLAFITFSSCWILGFRLPLLVSRGYTTGISRLWMRTGYRLCWIQVAMDTCVLDTGFAGYRVFAIYSFMFVPSCF